MCVCGLRLKVKVRVVGVADVVKIRSERCDLRKVISEMLSAISIAGRRLWCIFPSTIKYPRETSFRGYLALHE